VSRFVIVSGLPASGKSTVGHVIAYGLGVPLLDKDVVLESLFERTTPTDAQGRNDLSRLADEAFRAQALGAADGVLVSWWRHSRSAAESGTPTQWLTSLSGAIVEVHCLCAPLVAAKRFVARIRHSGHFDGRRSLAELLVQFNEHAVHGPLGIGSLVQIRTDEAVNKSALLSQVNHAFEASRHAQTAA
jgi:hypothetical protein